VLGGNIHHRKLTEHINLNLNLNLNHVTNHCSPAFEGMVIEALPNQSGVEVPLVFNGK
jgi:hypothetical protein